MPESRSAWKGQIKFGLIAFDVALHAVLDSAARPGFRTIHVPTGEPIEMQRTVPGIGPVPDEEVGRGIEIARDQYVVLDEEELAAIPLASRKVVDLEAFLHPDTIDALHYDKAYFVLPEPGSAAAYKILRDAMRSAKRIGIGKIAMRTGESVAIVRPHDDGLVLETLHYPDEIRSAEAYFSDLELPATPGAAALGKELLLKLSPAGFDLDAYSDRYRDEVMRIAKEKARTGTIKRKSSKGKVATAPVDLLEVLRKSTDQA